jgi:hypothetical protein
MDGAMLGCGGHHYEYDDGHEIFFAVSVTCGAVGYGAGGIASWQLHGRVGSMDGLACFSCFLPPSGVFCGVSRGVQGRGETGVLFLYGGLRAQEVVVVVS